MRILLVVQNYLPFIGGIETHVRQLAHELAHEHHVEIVAGTFQPYRGPRRLGTLHTTVLAPSHADTVDDGIAVHALTPTAWDRVRLLPVAARAIPRLQRYAFDGLHRFGYPWFRSVYRQRMRKIMSDVDLVHAHAGTYLGWLARECAAERDLPYVVTPYVHPHQWGDGPDDTRYYRSCHQVVGLVETDKEYLASLGIDRDRLNVIGVSPDLPPTQDGAGFRSRHGLGEAPVILYVGRMMAQKGAAAILAAGPIVWEKHPDARFVFVGPASPAEAAAFEQMDRRILYLGKVPAQEKADALAACDVFCMPSMSEILPTVYLEAWSLGKVVVGGRAHGLQELVEGNGAGFCSGHDASELSGALDRLLADAPLRARLGEAGRRLVGDRYTVPAVTRALVSVYRKAIDEAAAAAGGGAS